MFTLGLNASKLTYLLSFCQVYSISYSKLLGSVRLEQARELFCRARAEPEPRLVEKFEPRASSSLAKFGGPGPKIEPEPRLEQSLVYIEYSNVMLKEEVLIGIIY